MRATTKRFANPSLEDEKNALSADVLLAQKGDEQAFTRLIEVTRTRIYSFCLYLTGKPELAEDLFQDTYVKALENIRRLKEASAFRSWLLQIARNLFLDHLRRPKNRATSQLEENREISMAGGNAELILQIRQILATLEPDDRVLLLLVDLLGHSYAEAAEIMEVTQVVLTTRLHRARKAFLDKAK